MVLFEGRDLRAQSPTPRCAQVRGAGIAMIFQEPMTALNPLLHASATRSARCCAIHTELSKRARSARSVLAAAARTSACPTPRARCAPIRMNSPAASASA